MYWCENFCFVACADGVVRVFRIDDASSKSFKYEFSLSLFLCGNYPFFFY